MSEIEDKKAKMREEAKQRLARRQAAKEAELKEGLGLADAIQSSFEIPEDEPVPSAPDESDLVDEDDDLEEIEFASTNVGIQISKIQEEAKALENEKEPAPKVAKKSGCPFCDAEAKLPSHIVFSDETATVLMHNAPQALGHLLIFPAGHIQSLSELDPSTLSEISNLLVNLSKALKKVFPKAFGVSTFASDPIDRDGKASHFHFHLIPRAKGDGFSAETPKPKRPKDPKTLQPKILKAIKRHFQVD